MQYCGIAAEPAEQSWCYYTPMFGPDNMIFGIAFSSLLIYPRVKRKKYENAFSNLREFKAKTYSLDW